MSSCVIAVEPAVSEETEEPCPIHHIFRYIVPMTPRQGTHSARDSWRKCAISALIRFYSPSTNPLVPVKYKHYSTKICGETGVHINLIQTYLLKSGLTT